MLTLKRNIVFSLLFHVLVAASVVITGMSIVGEKKNFIVVSFVEESLQSEKPGGRAIPARAKDQHRKTTQKGEMSGTEKAGDSSPLINEDIQKAKMRSLDSMVRAEESEYAEEQPLSKEDTVSTDADPGREHTITNSPRGNRLARPLSNASVGENSEKEFDSRGLIETGTEDAGSGHAAGLLLSSVESGGSSGPDPLRTIQKAIEKAKHYPYLAKKRGIEGIVTTVFTIDQAGNPEQIRIIRSSGSRLLDSAAQKTIRAASPFPRVTGSIEIAISYRLKE